MPNQPGRSDNHYHNYVYPDGLFPGYAHMQVTKHKAGSSLDGRIDTIRLPLPSLLANLTDAQRAADVEQSMSEVVGNINWTSQFAPTAHTVRITTGNPREVIFTANYNNEQGPIGQGGKPGEELLDGIITAMVPRVANKADMHGPNTISALGRIAPCILVAAKKQLKDHLLRPTQSNNDTLLKLRDRIIPQADKSSPASKTLTIPAAEMALIFDKECREGQLLVRILENSFRQSEQANWIVVDSDFFVNRPDHTRDINAQKLSSSIENKTDPLYITTTSGGHAFGIQVDFKSKTLFVANAAGDLSTLQNTIGLVQQATGCGKVVSVVNQPMKRDEHLPANDVCTADALAITHMLKTTNKPFTEGCLNEHVLQTGTYLRAGLAQEALQIERDHAPSFTIWNDLACYLMNLLSGLNQNVKIQKETPENAWNQACKQLKDLVDTGQWEGLDESGLLSAVNTVTYTATYMNDAGEEETITPIVPVALQIALDELYARKLDSDNDSSDSCHTLRT